MADIGLVRRARSSLLSAPPSAGRPINSRTRSNTVVAVGPSSMLSNQGGAPSVDLASSALRVVTDPKVSAAAAALTNISRGEGLRPTKHDQPEALKPDSDQAKNVAKERGRTKGGPLPDPPLPEVTTIPSAPEVRPAAFNDEPLATPVTPAGLFDDNKIQLTLYTYKTGSQPGASSQPSPLPSKHSFTKNVTSQVLFNFASLPWRVRYGDYLEIRRTDEEANKDGLKGSSKAGESDKARAGGEALKGVSRKHGRDGYIFRVGEDAPNVAVGQIQVPESVATAFKFQHRLDIDLFLVRRSNLDHQLTNRFPTRQNTHAISITSNSASPSTWAEPTCGDLACLSRTRPSTSARRFR